MSDYIPENYAINTFNDNLKKIGIDKEYTAEEIASIFCLASKFDENEDTVDNEVFLDVLLKNYNMTHKDVDEELASNLLSFSALDYDAKSISEYDIEQAFGLDDVHVYDNVEILIDGDEVSGGNALNSFEKTSLSFKETSKVKIDDYGNYYVDVEKYDGDHSKNGCVWDIVYNSYDLSNVNVSWNTLKEAIYKANGGEKMLHPGDKVILPPLDDIIAGTVKSPEENAYNPTNFKSSDLNTEDTSTAEGTNDPATSNDPVSSNDPATSNDPETSTEDDTTNPNTNTNTMEPSGNLELKGEVTSAEGNAYINSYNNFIDKSNPDDVKSYIGCVLEDENVSISDKMKILNMIYKDSDVDNSSTLKSYFSESDKFYIDVLNEIANNRDIYTYGDLESFLSNYSLFNNNTVLDDEGNVKYAQFSDKEQYINAWVNVLKTAQNQDEINKIINRVHRNSEEKGMLTLTEAIYEYTDNPAEAASNVLSKEAEAFNNKTDYSDFNIEENRANELIDNYNNGFNGVLKAIVDLKDDTITNNELLYVVQKFCNGDINNLFAQINELDSDVQKAVYVVLQEAYKNTDNAFDLLEKVTRNDSQNIANDYANTISTYLETQSAQKEDGGNSTETETPNNNSAAPIRLDFSGDVSDDPEAQEYLNNYKSFLENKNESSTYKDDISNLIKNITSDDSVSISDKMKLLKEINKEDSDILKENKDVTNKFFIDAINEIAENRNVYTSIDNFTDLKSAYYNIQKESFSDNPEYLEAFVNLVETAKYDEVSDLLKLNYAYGNSINNLSEQIYNVFEEAKATELVDKVLIKASEQEAYVSDNRKELLKEKYNDISLTDLLDVILHHTVKNLNGNDLKYLIELHTDGDVDILLNELKDMPLELRKGVSAIIQDIYRMPSSGAVINEKRIDKYSAIIQEYIDKNQSSEE